jgi:hypothetical protein
VIVRKLKGVGQALDSITTQNNIMQFLNDSKNAQKLNSLVGDIHDTLMDYQVSAPKPLAHITSNNDQTSLQQDIYDKSCQMIVGLALLLLSHT